MIFQESRRSQPASTAPVIVHHRRALLLLIGIFSLSIVFASANTYAAARQPPRAQTAIVKVPVATLWSEPSLPTVVTRRIATARSNYDTVVGRLSTDERLSLVGLIETQVLMGERVRILSRERIWSLVAAINQPTPKDRHGYPGWVLNSQLQFTTGSRPTKSHVVVTVPSTVLQPLRKQQRPVRVSFGTRLEVIGKIKQGIRVRNQTGAARFAKHGGQLIYVRLPSGDVRAVKSSDIRHDRTLKPSAEALIASANRFIGIRYLWGGTSGFGPDCAGFMYRLFEVYGIRIPRDSGPQLKGGKAVTEPVAGDLVLFTHPMQRSAHHVGLYIGNGKIIHSPNSASRVRIDQLYSGQFVGEKISFRRYLKH